MRFENYMNEQLGSIRQAYFISPFGKIISCGKTHIQKIIEDPKLFGYTKEEIEKIYDKYNEKVGQEGKAREEILKDLLKEGWVRLRRYKNMWAVTIDKMNKKIKDRLQSWAEKIQTGLLGFKEQDVYTPVKINGRNYKSEYTVKEISNDVLYRANESKEKKYKLIIEEERYEI